MNAHAPRTAAVAAAMALISVLSAGCVVEGPPLEPRGTRTIPEPAGLEPATIVLSAEPVLVDSDGNGFGDTFMVSVFLFPPEDEHPLPIFSEGRFIFTMSDERGAEIARWDIAPEQTRRARERLLVGPGHVFRLSLLEAGGDRVDAQRGDVRCRFVPEAPGAEPLTVRVPTTVMLGSPGPR